MPMCRSSGACAIWMIEYYRHSAPLALRTKRGFQRLLICKLLSYLTKSPDSSPKVLE
jgi:hypothetical protein